MLRRPPRLYKIGGKQILFIKEANGYVPKVITNGKSDDEVIQALTGSGSVPPEEVIDAKDIEKPDDYDPLSHEGLYDSEMMFMAKKLKLPGNGFLGIVSIDKIHELADQVSPGIKQFGFIFNTDQSSGKGIHWIAVSYVAKNKSLDYYNSLAEPPTDQFLSEIKTVIDKLKLPYYLKFKVNTIARQSNSQNCGYHAILFLYRVLVLHETYKLASGYSETRNGEKDITEFKNKLEKFGYI